VVSLRWHSTGALPIVEIHKATFYRQYPTGNTTALKVEGGDEKNESSKSKKAGDEVSSNSPIFSKLSFSLPTKIEAKEYPEHWAVVSPAASSRTAFLSVVANRYICIPPTARSYPYLSSPDIRDPSLRTPDKAIQYVGFDAERGGLGGTSVQGAYLSARYESRREETDWSLRDYLEGNTELNALEKEEDSTHKALLQQVVHDFELENLLSRPVSNLSNGQTRRARIAKTLLAKPELVLLDGPFMGLDPSAARKLSELLHKMSESRVPRLLLSLRPEDILPPWISHIIYINSHLNILAQGNKQSVFEEVCTNKDRKGFKQWPTDAALLERMWLAHDGSVSTTSVAHHSSSEIAQGSQTDADKLSRDAFPQLDPAPLPGDPVLEMDGVVVSYGPSDSPSKTTVLGEWQQSDSATPGLHWSIHRNQRWGIFGPNGSGKTTLLSLITSDHPQAYSLPIKLFGKSRLPGPGEAGISIFELQKRIGHSSPEIHSFFPKHLSLRRVLESAWADAPLAKPKLSHKNDRVVECMLRWFAVDFNPRAESVSDYLHTLWHKGFLIGARSDKRRDVDRAQVKKRLERFDAYSDDLDWADTLTFRDLSFAQQRLALFLRAIVASPDLVILDEAFSGMDEDVKRKALLFLSHGEKLEWGHGPNQEKKDHGQVKQLLPSVLSNCDAVIFEGLTEQQTLLAISHAPEDVPGCVRQWVCLPEPGQGTPPRWGSLPGPLELNPECWGEIWASKS